MHDYLLSRGLRDRSEISLVMPLPLPIPPAPAASEALLSAFQERNIRWYPNQQIRELADGVAVFADGTELPFDLFLGVPVHRVPRVVAESGMTVDGWVPVNPLTLETSYPGVFAVGDVTSVGTPKAGVFSEGQAAVAADRIAAIIRGGTKPSEYDGRGMCYLEFGNDEVARVDVTFAPGKAPIGIFEGPSEALAADKVEFGSSRVRRWFGREWSTVGSGG
jgi:sulfide:quinone oxidoreductase